MEEVMSLLQPINITQVLKNADGTDINFWIQDGVPGKSRRWTWGSLHTASDLKQSFCSNMPQQILVGQLIHENP